ncbi:MAG: Nal1-like putative serine protease [Pirellulales bacterium]
MASSRWQIRLSVLLVAIGLALAVVRGATAADPPANPRAWPHVMQVQTRHTPALMAIKGLVGTATGADALGQPVVKVFVAHAGVAGVPANLEGVPVEVEVTGRFLALAKKPPGGGVNPAARFERPVPIGVSTGHPAITAGTIGCRVKDASGAVYALSNNHVYANSNAANLGDSVLQPGPYDGGTAPNDTIGTLSVFVPIDFYGPANTVDAAIALSGTGRLGQATPSNGYGTPRATTTPAYVGLNVKKYGRTTGLTKGRVYATNGQVNVDYGGGHVAYFVNQIIVTPGTFSAGGDSGSLVVVNGGANDRKPVGLLFAGSNQYTICNPIDSVLSALSVTIDGN